MKKLKSNLGLIAFLMLAVAATSFLFISNVSSQEQRKSGNDTSISWSPKKREINSRDSKVVVNLPESVSSQNLVIGVMPVGKDEKETVVVGVVSWKDSKMGKQTVIDSVVDLSDESVTSLNGQIDLASSSTAFGSDSGKSLIILLKTKPETEISASQAGREVLAKTYATETGVIARTEPTAMETVGVKRITGVSSLLGELQTRKMLQRFGKNKLDGGKN